MYATTYHRPKSLADAGVEWAFTVPGESFLGWADRPPSRLRIGRWLQSPMPDATLEPQVGAAFEDACRQLEALGHDVEDAPPDLLGPDVLPSFERVWALSGTTLPVPSQRVGELRPLTRELRARGMALSAQAAMGSMTAPDKMCAPTSEPFSSTTTDSSRPAAAASCLSLMAAESPAGPAPTITTSKSIASRGGRSAACAIEPAPNDSSLRSIGRARAQRQAP